MKQINIDTWKRKEHFEFFSAMKSPFLGITANVNCTKAYKEAKEKQVSFFAYYMHKSIAAVNSIPEFKYRIIDNEIYEVDKINVGTTLGRDDQTFAFAYVEYDEKFDIFNESLKAEIESVKNSTGLRFHKEHLRVDLIRYTTIPWLNFTAVLHPTNFNEKDSVPRISFGKMFEENGELFLPVSVEAHHGLMDGYHVCQYFKEFENLLNA
ncbi:MAG TPA: chloramphenicol acetyltransferase [Porphyromonadaceae bacterium]|nr:chloramphenicol acetyltransferase [Porphyromonadaceae bacterium]